MSDATDREDEGEKEPAPPAPEKKSKVSLLIAVAGALALVVGIWLSLRSSPSNHNAEEKQAATKEAAATEETSKEKASKETGEDAHGEGSGPMTNIDALVVNLSDLDELHYLKCSVAVELADPKWLPEFEKHSVRIRNSALLYLSSLRLADTIGTENKEKIQKQLWTRVTAIAGSEAVKGIYLTEFVLQ
jgi:flagellar basal body-associated protein FliL